MNHHDSDASGAPGRSIGAARRVLVAAIVVIAIAGGTGVVAAGEHHRACPGDNPNVGLERADERGVANSARGIAVANTSIGCPPLDAA